jgi:proteasome lid subunit RPN8/RPN11
MFRAAFQGTVIRSEPAYRPRPDTMEGYHKFSNGDYDAFVAIGALEAIAERTRRAAPDEMIGYLAGRPFRDAKGSYAVVTEAIFAQSARCGPTTVETTLDDEQGLLATLSTHHPLAERLGWFHSHPFWLPTYSQPDKENQRYWSEPYQLGLLACLDLAGGVSVFAFRGPEAEASHPPYTALCSSRARLPAFRPVLGKEDRETAASTLRHAEQKSQRPSLWLLTLAVLVVWPIAYLAGVWMIVQAIRESRDDRATADWVGQPTKKTSATTNAPGSGGCSRRFPW